MTLAIPLRLSLPFRFSPGLWSWLPCSIALKAKTGVRFPYGALTTQRRYSNLYSGFSDIWAKVNN